MKPQTLKELTDKVLVDSLSPRMKTAIDNLIARGMNKRSIRTVVGATIQKATGGDPCKGQLVMNAVDAYLDSK